MSGAQHKGLRDSPDHTALSAVRAKDGGEGLFRPTPHPWHGREGNVLPILLPMGAGMSGEAGRAQGAGVIPGEEGDGALTQGRTHIHPLRRLVGECVYGCRGEGVSSPSLWAMQVEAESSCRMEERGSCSPAPSGKLV